jgi:hypothetical protein
MLPDLQPKQNACLKLMWLFAMINSCELFKNKNRQCSIVDHAHGRYSKRDVISINSLYKKLRSNLPGYHLSVKPLKTDLLFTMFKLFNADLNLGVLSSRGIFTYNIHLLRVISDRNLLPITLKTMLLHACL